MWVRVIDHISCFLSVLRPLFPLSAFKRSFIYPVEWYHLVHSVSITHFLIYNSSRSSDLLISLFNSVSSVLVSSVEPKVYVSPGSLSLLAGDGETLVATCTAERGRPASEVLWMTDLDGQTDVMTHEETDGTTTTLAHFIWAPTREGFGSALSCIVRHPALSTEFRIPYQLNILCEYKWGYKRLNNFL